MRRSIYIFIALILTTLSITSCSFETDTIDGDGNMEGMWHLERISWAAADSTGYDSIADYSKQRIFWSFQHELLQLRDFDSGHLPLLCRFDISDGKLSLHEFYLNVRSHDNPITNLSELTPYGIESLTPTFDYSISGSKLTLKSGNTTLNFVRF